MLEAVWGWIFGGLETYSLRRWKG